MMRTTPAKADFSFVAGEPTRILAVDDDPIMREFVAVYLAAPTTSIDAAESAEAGLAMLESNSYDILIVDIDMPGMNGIDMVSQIRSRPRLAGIPIVMVTGCEDVVSIDRAFEAGATSFVTKPLNWRLLNYHLRFVLRASGCSPQPSRCVTLPLAANSTKFEFAANGL